MVSMCKCLSARQKHTVRIHWYFFITYLCNSLQLPIQTLTAYVRLVISLHRYYQGKCKNYQCLSEITQSSDLKRESVIINSISVTLSKSFFFFFLFFFGPKVSITVSFATKQFCTNAESQDRLSDFPLKMFQDETLRMPHCAFEERG